MIKSSAEAKSSIITVTGSVLSILYILFSFIKLIIPPEKVNQLSKNCIFVRLIFKHFLKLFHSFFILITFEKNLGKNRSSCIIFRIDFE